jgi:GDP-L-fucose synthase
MDKNSKILVLGARGMVGSALIRELTSLGYKNLLGPMRSELDLLNQAQTLDYFYHHKPEFVFDAAAKVGGILANNTYRADFIFENLQVQNHLFEACFKSNVEKMLFLGSSCIYPRSVAQPIKEEDLLTGPLEPTNEPYAIAKIAGIKLAESFRRQYGKCFFSVMPTNLYGPNDTYHLENSHVIPGLIARMYEAKVNEKKSFQVWGSGKPKREFLYVDDLAKACVMLMGLSNEQTPTLINVGSGIDLSIAELAGIIKRVVGYEGMVEFDLQKPDGTIRKVMDISKITKLGWQPQTTLETGLYLAFSDFIKRHSGGKT